MRTRVCCVLSAVVLSMAAGRALGGFDPRLVRVEVSDTCVAPGETFDVSLQWVNAGDRPSISYMIPILQARLGEPGFVNFDSGLWQGGNVFHLPCGFATPTTAWEPGQRIVMPPQRMQVPANASNGYYSVVIGIYDRGGRLPLPGLSSDGGGVPLPSKTYAVATVRVSKEYAAEQNVPFMKDFDGEASVSTEVAASPAYNWSSHVAEPVGQLPAWVSKPVTLGTDALSITLDADANHALAAVTVDGVVFDTGGRFPAVALFDASGQRLELAADDPSWRVEAKSLSNEGCRLIYRRDGFAMAVDYKIDADQIDATCTPLEETTYKALLMCGGGSSLFVPADRVDSRASSFIVAPETGGKLVSFDGTGQSVYVGQLQSWAYPASFVGIGSGGRGLILRAPQFGAEWTYGKQPVRGRFGLYADAEMPFRPYADHFDMPIVEPSITFQFRAVHGDVNGDNVFNWVDVGVAYRRAFIKGNQDPDTHLRDAYIGKIQISGDAKSNATYDELIDEIRQLNDVAHVDQVWWLVGAHSPPNHGYVTPPYSALPDPCHNGPNGYDFFALKKDAAAIGARIGIHETLSDISRYSTLFQPGQDEPSYDWPYTALSLDEDGHPMPTWGAVNWCVYAKALHTMIDDGRWFQSIRDHFKAWQVGPGDTWHWDCFTAVGGRYDYNPAAPATPGSDLRARLATLRFIKEQLHVRITSEGLQEGLNDYCDFAWHVPVEIGPRTIPLLPVLFQGKMYYSMGWKPAYCLMMGGKPAFEADRLDVPGIAQAQRIHNVYWSRIADLIVNNVVQTPKGYRIEYEGGGSLDVDLANYQGEMSFELHLDGQTYTPDNPPPTRRAAQ